MAAATLLTDLSQDETENGHDFSSLSSDVSLQCLARVPRSHYRSLSSVCKSWQTQIHSQTLYSTRKALNTIDFSLCLNLRLPNTTATDNTNPPDHTLKWYELFPSSNGTARNLFEITSPPSAQPIGASIVSLGSKIYVIGGVVRSQKSQTMWVYDLISDKWELAASQMSVTRKFAAAVVVNGKIYVMGGCRVRQNAETPNWAEVFDPETGLWTALPSPGAGIVKEGMIMHACAVVGERILYSMEGSAGLVFDTASSEWSQLGSKHDMGFEQSATVVIDGVFYCSDYSEGRIRGYDFNGDKWKEVKEEGEVVFPKFVSVVKMANLGGKLVVLWKEKGNVYPATDMEMEFHGAVIEIRKDGVDGEELWGSIAWTGVVGKAPAGSYILHCLAVGL